MYADATVVRMLAKHWRGIVERLKNLVEIQAGHPFRGSVAAVDDGNALAVQVRDVSAEGSIAWEHLVRTQVDETRSPRWLQPNDVLFIARGHRHQAICLTEIPHACVCSEYFFVLRVRSSALLPAFLAWQINRAPAQRYFASNAEGSAQLNVRKGVLEALEVMLPPLRQQQALVDLAGAVEEERARLNALIRNRQQQLDALAFDLVAREVR